jgi:hypothetical protein
VRILSSTVLDVLTPESRDGYAALDVMNTDGTSAFNDRSFRFFIPPPVITSFSPASGPPGTVITIQGNNLVGHLGFVSVYFRENYGAEVLSASRTEIRAVVPYFPGCECMIRAYITESGFSNSVGPFTVIGTPATNNRAAVDYNFTDASVAAGGTALNFSSSTSAKAIVTMPFDFVLFRDLFPAGSPLAITTNGYATFHAEAPIVSGYPSLRTPHNPTSIISPFLATLEYIPGLSSISTRVVGAAPNRQFVIQWSRMAALDGVTREGCPFTFQAVLFEGTFDIKYVYETLGCSPRISAVTPTEIGMYSRSGTFPIPFSGGSTMLSSRSSRTYTFTDGVLTITSKQLFDSIQVVDGGAATSSTSELSAAWYWNSLGYPATYRYAVGRTPGTEDVVPFTTTTATNVTVRNLNLTPGATYYFTVRGTLFTTPQLETGTGTSNGIRVDNSRPVPAQVVAFAPYGGGRFTGIALKASSASSVTLRAIDSTGQERGTTSLELTAGQQYARLVSELFGLETFDGWVEIQSSDLGLNVYVNTGYLDGRNSDGAVVAENMSEFVALHAGWHLYLVNPSPRQASVTLRSVAGSSEITASIPPRGRIRIPLPWPARVSSSEPLAAIEVLDHPGRMSLSMPESRDTRSSLLFAHGVIGQDYVSAVTLVNSGATPTTARVSFAGHTMAVEMPGNSVRAVSLSGIAQAVAGQLLIDAVRVVLDPPAQVAGVVDLENSHNSIALASGVMAREFQFGHIAQNSAWFTGICLVSGNAETVVTIDVLDPSGRHISTGEFLLAPNRQVARLIEELGAFAWNQIGGHIRIRSDQPILAWEVFGTQDAFSSSPPLR